MLCLARSPCFENLYLEKVLDKLTNGDSGDIGCVQNKVMAKMNIPVPCNGLGDFLQDSTIWTAMRNREHQGTVVQMPLLIVDLGSICNFPQLGPASRAT